MSKSDLKAAMESLQVKKPFILPARQPQFKAPAPVAEPTVVPTETQVATPTEVATATQVPAATPVDTHTPVAGPTSVPAPTQIAAETMFAAPTQARAATQVAAPTLVARETPVPTASSVVEPTSVSKPTQVPTETRVAIPAPVVPTTPAAPRTQEGSDEVTPPNARDQDSSVALEALAAPKLHNGYTRLPNNVLMRMAAGELVRSEIQVLLLIARFTISFQRRHAPLSKTVLERQSGLRGPAVLQAVADLVAKGLIEKIPGDQHRPNQLGLVFTEEWDFFPKGPGTGKTPVAATTPVAPQILIPTATAAPVSAATPAGVPTATHYKDTQTIENKLSLPPLPETLETYFAELKPAKKRASEWQAYQGLRREYSGEDIAACLALLLDRGIGNGETAQPCHSPMAFLSKAIGAVLPEAMERQRKTRERQERERREAEAKRLRAEEEAREAAIWAEKERAFESTFPSIEKQEEVLTDLLRGLPLAPRSQPGRIMGIGRWWDEWNQTERAESRQGGQK